MIVNGGYGDGRDVRPRDCVRDHIVFSAYVTYIGGKLANEKQVASLTRKTLSGTGEGKSERLMISEDGELVTLNVVVKVFYREEDCQQFTIKYAVLLLGIGEFLGKESHRVPDAIK